MTEAENKQPSENGGAEILPAVESAEGFPSAWRSLRVPLIFC